MTPRFSIREFAGAEDHRQCERLQQLVWEGDYPVPTNMTITLQRHGGLSLGAFDDSGRMLGFVISMLSPAHQAGAKGHTSHHSHIAAVLPELQGQRIGEALKLRQAEELRARGFNLLTWTYDPLEARNARLNIHKLGAVCRIFIQNCYGEMRDVMNMGLPSDRFEVEWWLDEKRTADTGARVMGGGALRVSPEGEQMHIDIPADFQALKRNNLDEAHRVRLQVRDACERAFSEGFLVTDFTVLDGRAYYTLTKVS
jgi:chorismate synthase